VKLIVGLGNPGATYESTRHNVGFMFLDVLARDQKVSWKKAFNGEVASIMFDEEKVLLFKPLTYMNCSGEPLQKILGFYKLSILDILVIHDDVDLASGIVRFREKGSSGGHNGLNSIIRELGVDTFARIKIGIGRPPHSAMAVADYVLQRFTAEELQLLDGAFKTTELQLEKWLKG
jgi:peptidyl-tRNA hydrolase, PTH1 family